METLQDYFINGAPFLEEFLGLGSVRLLGLHIIVIFTIFINLVRQKG